MFQRGGRRSCHVDNSLTVDAPAIYITEGEEMSDFDAAAFKTELENNVRYDATVVSGSNAGTLELLDELEPTKTTFVKATPDQVRQAIGDGIRTLTAAQIQALRFLVNEQSLGSVDFNVPAIRQELAQIFATQPTVTARLTALASRPRKYGEAWGRTASLGDVRLAVAQIAKAFINQ